MTNHFTLDSKAAELSTKSYVRASLDRECQCGNRFQVTMEWPENLTVNGPLSIDNACCPVCAEHVVLPEACYYVENFHLLSKPME